MMLFPYLGNTVMGLDFGECFVNLGPNFANFESHLENGKNYE